MSPLSDFKNSEHISNMQSKVDKAQVLLDDALAEDKHGFNINNPNLNGKSEKYNLKDQLN